MVKLAGAMTMAIVDEYGAARPDQTGVVESRRKWADYSFIHGGKDGHPFPVDRATYDRNITVLTEAVRKARLGETEKSDALKRLAKWS